MVNIFCHIYSLKRLSVSNTREETGKFVQKRLKTKVNTKFSEIEGCFIVYKFISNSFTSPFSGKVLHLYFVNMVFISQRRKGQDEEFIVKSVQRVWNKVFSFTETLRTSRLVLYTDNTQKPKDSFQKRRNGFSRFISQTSLTLNGCQTNQLDSRINLNPQKGSPLVPTYLLSNGWTHLSCTYFLFLRQDTHIPSSKGVPVRSLYYY